MHCETLKIKQEFITPGLKFSITYLKILRTLSWNVKKFKLVLKRFLLVGSFYSLDECFDWISRSNLGTFTETFS